MIEKLKRVHELIEDLSIQQTASLLNRTEIAVIIEALQMKKDLETVVNSKRQLDVLLSSTGGVLAIVQKHAAHHRFVSVYGDTIPAALRAAAKAIQKGGTE